jgi:hypothetical protein
MAITSIKTGSSFTNLVKYNDFLAGNPSYVPSSYESIASVTAAGGETSLNFTSIPGTYASLQIRGIGKWNSGSTGSGWYDLRFNSSTTNYRDHYLMGDGSGATAGSVGTDRIQITNGATRSPSAYDNMFGTSIVDIYDYASTTKNKTLRAFSGIDVNAGFSRVTLVSGLWADTSAITSINLLAPTTWIAGSTFALYGIK